MKTKKAKQHGALSLCGRLDQPQCPLRGHVRKGLDALDKKHRRRVDGEASCSAKIDGVLKQKVGQKIFDYLVVSSTCRIHIIEDHSATSPHHITEMRDKKRGTEEILKANAYLRDLFGNADWNRVRWIWTVTNGNVAFHGHSKYAKQIADLKIEHPTKRAVLQ